MLRDSGSVRPGAKFGPEDDPHEIGQELGCGAAARVFACCRLRSGEEFAVKVINLKGLRLMGERDELKTTLEKLTREVEIQRKLRHVRIVNLQHAFITKDWYYLVMERVRGGELFEHIVQKQGLSEAESRHVFRQLLEGVSYMHTRGVIHRDIKPENILVVDSRPAVAPMSGTLLDVKIADFGLSKIISEGVSTAKTVVGTPQYWAPEVLNVRTHGGTYGAAADLWGLGAVLFVMLCGRYPFDGRKQPLEEQIRTASFHFGSRWRGISEDAKSLVKGLLRVDPKDRFPLEACFCHPWVMDVGPSCSVKVQASENIDPWAPALSPSSNRDDQRLSTNLVPLDSWGAPLPVVSEEKMALDPARSLTPLTPSSDATARSLSSGRRAPSERPDRNTSEFSVKTVGSSVVDESEDSHDGLSSCIRRFRQRYRFSFWFGFSVLFALICSALTSTTELAGRKDLQPMPAGQRESMYWTGGRGEPLAEGSQGSSCNAAFSVQAPNLMQAESSGALQVRVPAIPVRSIGPEITCEEQETVFHLTELLKLQVSIIGSLKTASIVFRHADWELANATHQTFLQAREIFQRADNVISSFADTAHQVSDIVLPDLLLAVEENVPVVAINLLNYVKERVAKMKSDGEVTRSQYAKLQEAVMKLAHRAQQTKTNADRNLMEAVKALETASYADPADDYALQPRGHGSGFRMCTSAPVESSPGPSSSQATVPEKTGFTVAASELGLNIWTRTLFEHLGNLASGQRGLVAGFSSTEEDVWKRDVLDLLFMAPGVLSSVGPDHAGVPTEGDDDEGKSDEDGEGDEQEEPTSSSVVPYEKGSRPETMSGPEYAARSAASLLRALKELRRVDVILRGCSSFWTNMDGTVQKLANMKEHTEALVSFATENSRLMERFKQRLEEYSNFWASLERICRQYGLDHRAASERMFSWIRDVEDAVDLAQTTEKFREGVFAARADAAEADTSLVSRTK